MKHNKLKIFLIITLILIILTLITVSVIFVIKKYSNPTTNEPIDITNYTKTEEIMKENNAYQEKYEQEYASIDYTDIENFPTIINNLLNKNYTAEEINSILKNYSSLIDVLLTMKHVDILKLAKLTNYDETKLNRYLDYYEKNDYDIATAVTYVNIGLDLEGYSEYITYNAEEAKDITILVNKYHKLPDDYEPDDLVSLSYNENYKLRKEAAEAFEKLTSAGVLENVIFYPFSPYRSFKTQEVIYNRYVKEDGQKNADTYSARPGFSEHQLGLAVDVRSSSLTDNLTEEQYNWMLNNSYKYGFIIRYPKGKQHITQYIEEPWHIRYLGIELATKVHDSGLTYDEYYDLYMKNC